MFRSRTRHACVALFIIALVAMAMASSASAKLTGEYERFAQCPYTNLEVKKCLFSVTGSGEVVLGSSNPVSIVNPVTLQGGVGAGVEGIAPFFAATNGVTLSKSPQPVPGGLAALVNCKEIKEPFVRFTCELAFENGLTGLNSTLELALPASEIRVSENNLAAKKGVALKMPVKVHLENPFLGSNCYVGSSSSPIWWELTTGTTAPPAPHEPITGAGGTAKFLEGGRIVRTENTIMVDNAWAAPGATGCGGFLVELILDPIVNVQLGTTTAGHNTAILNNTVWAGAAAAVRKNNEENP